MLHTPFFDFIDLLLALALGVVLTLLYVALAERDTVTTLLCVISIIVLLVVLLFRGTTGVRANV